MEATDYILSRHYNNDFMRLVKNCTLLYLVIFRLKRIDIFIHSLFSNIFTHFYLLTFFRLI